MMIELNRMDWRMGDERLTRNPTEKPWETMRMEKSGEVGGKGLNNTNNSDNRTNDTTVQVG